MSENSNRAFLYGESVFTTMRMENGTLKDWEAHFDRLKKGAEYLFGPFTDGESWAANLRDRIEERIQGIEGEKVLRIAIFREQARGLLRTGVLSSHDLKVHCSVTPLERSRFEDKMLKLRSCLKPPKPFWWPSYLKAGNYLETILCQKKFLQPGDDDLLFLSPRDTVLESSVANIFIVRRNKLYTAPPGPDVLEGVMRRKILSIAGDYFDDCLEDETTLDQLYKADAVFGTNSLRGLFLVDRIDDHEIKYNEERVNFYNSLRQRILG